MPGRLRGQLTFANVASALALFFAISGSAYAAVIVTSNDDVAPDTIAGHKPGPGKHANLILGSVTNEDLAPETVKTGRITDGTVAARDLSADSVDGSKVIDESIGSADLGPDSVGGGELQGTKFYGTADRSLGVAAGAQSSQLLLQFNDLIIFGRCSRSSGDVVTAKVLMQLEGANASVDSTAPGGANDAPLVLADHDATLASLGPTTGAHIGTGAFTISPALSAGHPNDRAINGVVTVGTHLHGSECRFSVEGVG
jgi:hypothetical protein